jgi:hypothetical protein
MFKGVWNCRLPADEADGALEDSVAWLEARDASFAFFWVGPGTEPDDLGARLEARGIDVWDGNSPCMVAELGTLDWEALERAPTGFRVERVGTDDELETFAGTFVAAFEIPEWAAQAWVDATRAFGIDEAPWALHVGFLDDDPVATTVVFCGAGVAGAFGIGTVPSARRLGIGAAITLAGFDVARWLGYRHGVLEVLHRRPGLVPPAGRHVQRNGLRGHVRRTAGLCNRGGDGRRSGGGAEPGHGPRPRR